MSTRLAALARLSCLLTVWLVPAVRAEAQAGTDSLSRTVPADAPYPADRAGPAVDSAAADSTPPPLPTPAAVGAATGAAASADTTLKKACVGAAPGTLAPGLLAVVFQTGTTREQAIAAAKSVGGTIAGMSDMGEVYVQVPASTGPLPVVADQLIRADPVTRVAPMPCPAAPPPAPAAGSRPPAADTAAAKPGDSAARARSP